MFPNSLRIRVFAPLRYDFCRFWNDVAQSVFVALAKNAAQQQNRPEVSGRF